MNESNKGGRPTRIEGEKAVKVSASVRPRYREVLDIVAKDRGITISDTIELAVLKLAENYMIDGQAVIDMVRPENEDVQRFYNAIDKYVFAFCLALIVRPNGKEFLINLLGNLRASDPKALYIVDVINSLKNDDVLVSAFNPILLSEALAMDFMEGASKEESLSKMDGVLSHFLGTTGIKEAIAELSFRAPMEEAFKNSQKSHKDIIEILKKTTLKNNTAFNLINELIKDNDDIRLQVSATNTYKVLNSDLFHIAVCS